jgi:hypothetical protein
MEWDHPAWFMEMRLGKTLVAIRWAIAKGLRTIIVMAPVTVLEAWEAELRREGETIVTAYGKNQIGRDLAVIRAFGAGRRTWLLMNYEAFLASAPVKLSRRRRWKDGKMEEYLKRSYLLPHMAKIPWDAVILDESTRIKSPAAWTSILLCEGFREARHRAILSGLPTPEGELDAVQQMIFLDGHCMGFRNYYHLRDKLFTQDYNGYGWYPKPGTAMRMRTYLHRRAFFKRRADAGMPELKVYHKRQILPCPRLRRLHEQVEEEYAIDLISGGVRETGWKLEQVSWLRHLAGGFDPERNLIDDGLLKELMVLLKGELSQQKVVVWFAFRHEVEFVRQALLKAKIPCASILGGDSLLSRKAAMEAFRGRGARILLATAEVAKYGSDYSVADAEIYYSNPWSCEARAQSEDRLYHPLKKTNILIVDLVFKGLIGEGVLAKVKKKVWKAQHMMKSVDQLVLERRYERADRRANK